MDDRKNHQSRGPGVKTLAAIGASLLLGLAAGVFLVGGPERGSKIAEIGRPDQRGGPGGQGGAGGGPGGGGGPRPGGFEQRPPAVTLEQPRKQPIEGRLSAIGTGRAIQSLTLTSDVSGLIEAIAVKKPGERVAAGAPLVILEKREQEIALARAKADYAIAKTNAARFRELRAGEAASALEQEAAQNEMTAATAALRQAEYELERRVVRAPFDGVVGLTDLDLGDFLATGAVITTIDDVSSLIVDFVVPENASPFIREGMEVEAVARASGGRSVKGVVRAVDSRVDATSRTRRIEAAIDNRDGALVPGSTFEISLAVKGRSGFIIPGLAIQWDRAGAYVWRAGAEGKAERVPVEIVERTANAVLVNADLSETDEIVSEGSDLVREGAPLKRSAADGPSSSGGYSGL